MRRLPLGIALASTLSVIVILPSVNAGVATPVSMYKRPPRSAASTAQSSPELYDALEWRRTTLLDENGVFNASGLYYANLQHDTAMHSGLSVGTSSTSTTSNWISQGPQNVGGRTRAILINPRNTAQIVAGSASGGVWISNDRGVTWQRSNIANFAIRSLAYETNSTSVIYAGTGEAAYVDALNGAGIFKSIDGGQNWTQLSSTLPLTETDPWRAVQALAADPKSAGTLLAGNMSGLWRTANGGATWTKIFPASSDVSVLSIQFDPYDSTGMTVIAATQDAQGNRSAAYSNDGGLSFSASTVDPPSDGSQYGGDYAVFAPPPPSQPRSLPISYLLRSPDLLKSVDGGKTFEIIYQPPQGQSYLGLYGSEAGLWISPTDGNLIVAGAKYLWRSIDGGSTFKQISFDQPAGATQPHVDQHVLVNDVNYGNGNATLFVGNDGGIFSAVDITQPTVSWTSLNRGYQTTQFYSGAGTSAGSAPLVGGTQDNGILLVTQLSSPNARAVWGGDGGFVAVDPTNPSAMYFEVAYTTAVMRSLDGGSTMSSIESSAMRSEFSLFQRPIVSDPNDHRTLLVGMQSLWRSTDADSPTPAWSAIRSPSSFVPRVSSNNITAVAVAPAHPDIIWVALDDGRIDKTINGTANAPSWNWVDDNADVNPLPARYVTRITIDRDDPNVVYVTFGGYRSDNIYRTTDGGATWVYITAGLPEAPVRTLVRHPRNAHQLYAGTDVGLYESNDAGQTWSASSQGPGNVAVDELSFVSGSETLLVATHGRGLWTADTSAVPCLYTIAPTSASVPSAAGTGSFTVVADNGCSWTATVASSATPWLQVSTASSPIPSSTVSGSGTTLLTFTLAANTSSAGRSGTITVGGQVFVVSQTAPCSVVLSPGGGYYANIGGSTNFAVRADSQCTWSAHMEPAVGWLTLTSTTGTGNGLVLFNISPNVTTQPNTITTPRYTKIVVNDKVFYVNQLGANPASCPVDSAGMPTFSIEGPTTLRNGQNLSLLAYPGKGFTYQWVEDPAPLNTNGIISSLQGPVIRPGSPGTSQYPQLNVPTTFTVYVASPGCDEIVHVSKTVTVTDGPSCTLPQFGDLFNGVVLSPGIGLQVTLGVTWSIPPTSFPTFQWYQGASGDYSHPISGATSQSVVVAPTADTMYWLAINNGCGDQLSGTWLVVLGRPPKHRAAGKNFTNVGKTDLLFRNAFTGDNVLFPINGSTLLSPVALPPFDAAWQAQTVTDLNSDGHPDIVWRNPTTGANAVWEMNGTTVLSTVTLESQDPAWNLAASADFIGDGNMDLVWQNSETNELQLWAMNGAQHAGSFGLGTLPSGDWVLEGTADFNQDGSPDLMFRNYRTGDNAIWSMNDATPPGFTPLTLTLSRTAAEAADRKLKSDAVTSNAMPGIIDSLPDTNWQVASLADVDGDGQPDIVWINSVTSEMMVWKMVGVSHVDTLALPPQSNPNLKIAGVPPIAVPSQLATTLTLNASTTTYGNAAEITGALQSNGTSVPGESIAVTIDGAKMGSAVTGADGTFTLTSSTVGLLAGTHTMAAQFAGDATYAANSAIASLQITPHPLALTWSSPAPITYGAALAAAQLNATALVPGTFTYVPSAGTILDAGANQQLSVLFTPIDALDYMPATASTLITVAKAPQAITWPRPADVVYGMPLSAAQLDATVSISGPAAAGSLTYVPAIGTILTGGDHVITVTAAETQDYSAASASVTLHVVPAIPTVTWPTPAPITYGTPLTQAQLNATASVPGTFAYSTAAGTLLAAGNHVLQVTFTPTDSTDFTSVSTSVTVTVTRAIPILQWTLPADIVYGTALSATQLNATTTIPGVLTYTPAAGSILDAGPSQSLQVLFTPTDAADYTAATATVSITVLKAPQTLSWPVPSPIIYGTPLSAAQLNATVSVPGPAAAGPLTYAPPAGSVLHAGTATLTVTAAETSNYTAATASVALTVQKAVPVLTWPTAAPITYGTPLGSQLNATANVDGTFTYSPSAGTVLDAGGQSLQVAFTPAESQNYTTATASITLTVNKAPQQLTWPTPAAIVYGTPLSAAQLNAGASVVGPAPAATLTYGPAAGVVLDAGAQTLTVTAAETRDYLAATATVTLAVVKAPLIVTAANATKLYGAALPLLTGTMSGVVNGDPITPVYATTATVASVVGSYPITITFADPSNRLRNYSVTTAAAMLSVTPASLVITTVNTSSQYSDPLPPFTVTFGGFVLGDTPSVLTGSLAFRTTATMTSAPGVYPLTVSGVSSENYAIRFVPGTVTITREDARVTFTGATMSSTTGRATATANVVLSATVEDISATPDANGDIWPGDIRHATITFVDRATNTPLCTAPLGLVRSDVLTIATGTCAWTTPLIASSTPTIGLVVDGYYTRNSPADDVPLTLELASDHVVTAGGFVIAAKSAGDLAADPASQMSFTIDADYKPSQPLLHGAMRMETWHTDQNGSVRRYRITAPVLTSLGVNDAQTAATITALNATITDVTDPKNPVAIGSDAVVECTLSQSDKAHDATIAFTAWKSDGGLWFTTNWNGSSPVTQPLDGGASQIH